MKKVFPRPFENYKIIKMASDLSKIKLAGVFIIAGIVSGLWSIAPAVDSADFLTEAAAHAGEVRSAAIFQVLMSLFYLGFAVLLFPLIKRFGQGLALGFLCLRVIAVILSLLGTILLISLLLLSEKSIQLAAVSESLKTVGNVLKDSRDLVNHFFMVLALALGNIFFYFLLLRSRLIPIWISIWGLGGNILSALAGLLLFFGIFKVITPEYLIMNIPTALQEIIFALWLIIRGNFSENFLPRNADATKEV